MALTISAGSLIYSDFMKRTTTLITTALLFGFAVQTLIAASIAGAGITVDGKHICGYAITWDNETGEEMLEMLKKNWLTFERDFTIPVDVADPDKAVLKGTIRVASHVRKKDNLVAELKSLTLVKRKGRWYVEEKEVDRLLKLAKAP